MKLKYFFFVWNAEKRDCGNIFLSVTLSIWLTVLVLWGGWWWWGVFTWHHIQHIPVTQDQQDHHWWSSWSSPLSSSSRRDVLTLADWSPNCPSLRETSGPPGLGGPWGTFSIRMEWGWDWLALSHTSPLLFVSLTVLSRPGLLQCSPTVTAGGAIPVKWRAVRRTQSVLRRPGRRPDWAD